jgi:hypothetical protein
MSLGIGLLVFLTRVMLAVVASWPYSKGWSLKPTCLAAFLQAIVLLLLQTGDL